MKLTKAETLLIQRKRNRTKVCYNSRGTTKSRKVSKMSTGEQRIYKFLSSECVEFKREWFFTSCYSPKTGRLLYFDFYLPEYNLCIEYDGEQHYNPNKTESAKINDFTKTAYCMKNKINFLRIIFDQFDNIETLICKKVDQITSKTY